MNFIKKYFKLGNLILSIILGIAFIISIWHLFLVNKNNEEIYTIANISSHLLNILWLIILYVVYNLCGILIKQEEKTKNVVNYQELITIYKHKYKIDYHNDETLKKINKQRIFMEVICGIFVVTSSIIILFYSLGINNYSQDGNKINEMIKLTFKLLPWVVTLLISLVAYLLIKEIINKQEFEILKALKLETKPKINKKSSFYIVNIVRVIVIIISVSFIIIGIVNNEYSTTLNKAIQICLECMGIG